MSNRKKFREQDELEEQQILGAQDPVQTALDAFFADGRITEILYTVKSGKEATVYCCEAGASMGGELVAAKIYRARDNRGFKNDAVYQEGRVILDGHARRAVQNKSRFGREAQFGMWVNSEYEALQMLYKAGATIPQPLGRTETAILMTYQGDRQQAAPALSQVALEPHEVHPLFDQIMDNIELFLANNYIHADLSPYNILYWQGSITIIDLPQAVDPRFNPNALLLLTRDIDNICQYMKRYGLERDSKRITERLWNRFKNAEL